MAQITGGTIKFGRKTAPAQYENKEAVVELSFSLAEGELLGDLLHEVAAQAQNKALEMVGLKVAAKANPELAKAQETKPDGFVTQSAKQVMKDITEKVVAETKTKEAYAAKKAEEAALAKPDLH